MYDNVVLYKSNYAGSEIDYADVMVEYEQQGHDWATRWTAAYPDDAWKPLLASAYRNFTAADELKFTRWLAAGPKWSGAGPH